MSNTHQDHRASWNASRDEAFFRIVDGLFPPEFLTGAGVLLASYDDATHDNQESPDASEATVTEARDTATYGALTGGPDRRGSGPPSL
jgi:hypothetical protein